MRNYIGLMGKLAYLWFKIMILDLEFQNDLKNGLNKQKNLENEPWSGKIYTVGCKKARFIHMTMNLIKNAA